MGKFFLGDTSLYRLEGVHEDLVKVVKLAIGMTPIDFAVLEGKRSLERQQQLFNSGASHTLNSRHLTGHAVDLGAYINGSIDWSWPLYDKIGDAMKEGARVLGVPLEWGGDWKTFKDGPHFQLPWSSYPAPKEV